jgi:hypothetical protein
MRNSRQSHYTSNKSAHSERTRRHLRFETRRCSENPRHNSISCEQICESHQRKHFAGRRNTTSSATAYGTSYFGRQRQGILKKFLSTEILRNLQNHKTNRTYVSALQESKCKYRPSRMWFLFADLRFFTGDSTLVLLRLSGRCQLS